jgi:hypothetical protein
VRSTAATFSHRAVAVGKQTEFSEGTRRVLLIRASLSASTGAFLVQRRMSLFLGLSARPDFRSDLKADRGFTALFFC